ncbi:ABC transporter ATP-binding protein [Streptomyces lonarensis]|uniref:Spermidine/putrescine import ATP-binding protein PotA n=1 Tax=Streptomyces lonarensis TaxID=700599 RepID=A0A7X6CXP3_9ACTN|nr:ABC transporter ATP-binding protein [Streptomyces lonarensis]NJQ04324.1 ABC transporter ATP-binding protein [Streptomyces lonarensis]
MTDPTTGVPSPTAAGAGAAGAPAADEGHLVLRDLVKTYPGRHGAAVRGVSLSVPRGAMLAVLGPSGCGKSTTLRMIAGLVAPSAGSVLVDGKDVTGTPAHHRDMGVVFQSYALFPHMDVAGNVAFGLEMRKVPRPERERRVTEALELVRLDHLARRRVSQLSGGQQQRVALARALVVRPTVLLLDEPLSNLDAQLRTTMREEIRRIQQETGITTVFVTHDQHEALSMADRVAVLHEGRLEQLGTPQEIYERPASRFTAEFVGRANLLPATVVAAASAGEAAAAEVEVPGIGRITAQGASPAPGEPVTVLLRPHRVVLDAHDPDGGIARGTVLTAGYTGETVAYRVRVGGSGPELDVELPSGSHRPSAPGAEVGVSWQQGAARLVPAAPRSGGDAEAADGGGPAGDRDPRGGAA